MAIAIDSTTPYVVPDAGGASVSFSHTCTGSNLYILVGICQRNADASLTISTGPAYNGVSMSLVGDSTLSPNSQARVRVYGLVAPDTGAHNVTFGMSSSGDGRTVAIARSYTGVDQSTPIGTAGTAAIDSGNPTVNVSSAVDELVSDFMAMPDGASSPAVGAGQTERANTANDSANGYGCSSDEAGAGTVTMSWTGGSGFDTAIVAVPIKPVGGGGSPALDDSDGFMLTTIQQPLVAVKLY